MEASLGIILSLLSATATALWTVWTWNEQHDEEQQRKRDYIAALYVNPFLLSAQELQNRLYEILNDRELEFFKKEYPETSEAGSPEALELLYVIVKFFGWYWYVYRFGPYTRDPKAIELIAKIIATFANCRDFKTDAFYFSASEQRSLGQTFFNIFGRTQSGYPELEMISLYKFAEQIKEDIQKERPLYQNVIKTIQAIDQAEGIEDLQGRDRLLVVHNHLIDLLSYLEEKEGFSLSPIPRRKMGNIDRITENIEVIHAINGRLRLRIPRLRQDESYRENLGQQLQALAGVEGVNINSQAASVAISYTPTLSDELLKQRIFALIGDLN